MLGAAILVYLLLSFVVFDFVVDDAYITYLYARHLVEDGQLVPVRDHFVQAYTNFLFVIVTAPLYAVAGRTGVESATNVLLVACGVTTLCVLRRLLGDLGVTGPAAACAMASTATSTPFVVWTSGGLETVFLAMLILATVAAYRRAPGGRAFWLLALACVLTRLDAIVFLAPLAATAAWRGGSRTCVTHLLLPLAAHAAWAYRYYGAVLPRSTLKLPQSLSELFWVRIPDGEQYLALFLTVNQHWIGFAAAIGIITAAWRRRGGELWPVAAGIVAHCAYLVLAGAVHMMILFRYYVPVIPVLFLLMGTALQRASPAVLRSVLVLIVVSNLATFSSVHLDDMFMTTDRRLGAHGRENWSLRESSQYHDTWKRAAQAFNRVVPRDARVRCWAAGIFPFFIDAAVYDELLLGGSPGGRYDYHIGTKRAWVVLPPGVRRYPAGAPDPRMIPYDCFWLSPFPVP
jgi:hypothetical protein